MVKMFSLELGAAAAIRVGTSLKGHAPPALQAHIDS